MWLNLCAIVGGTISRYTISMTRLRGFHHSEETKLKIALSNTGKHHSEEARLKMSITRTGRVSARKHQIALICSFCGSSYTRCLSISRTSKYCSRVCHNTVNARNQRKVDPEMIRLRKVWRSMIARCTDPKNDAYKDYGGRGIFVDKSWLDFHTFFNDMHPTYKSGLWLDRTDNDREYSKDNCAWRTSKEQAINKRNTRRLTYNNESLTIGKWASKLGIPESRISKRFYIYKWPVERTLS